MDEQAIEIYNTKTSCNGFKDLIVEKPWATNILLMKTKMLLYGLFIFT